MDFAVFKDLKNGSYMCNICVAQVKSKIWTAHTNGRKHRENVQQFKEALLSKSNQKRKLDSNDNDAIEFIIKKSRNANSRIRENENNDIHMDIEESMPNVRTPWQVEASSASSSNGNSLGVFTEQIIEGLPQGFFDNQDMNRRVRDTVEKQKQLDDEIDKFFKELAEDENKKDEEDIEEAEASAVNKDIELIDEQIERWRAINELEKKKEEVVESVAAARSASSDNPHYNCLVTGGNLDVNDEDDENDDFDAMNWRTKIL